jgi:hypothetical protein
MRAMRVLSWLFLAGWLLLPAVTHAQCTGIASLPVPFAKEALVISSTPLALTPGIYQPSGAAATMAQVTIEGGDIRWSVVGTPTAADGHYVGAAPPTTLTICGLESIKAFRAIRVGADAKATITYYKAKTP